MSDEEDIRARLEAHGQAFQGLLELIPAKFYNPEHHDAPDGQWNKRKQTKEEAKQAKRARLDPEQFGLTTTPKNVSQQTETTLGPKSRAPRKSSVPAPAKKTESQRSEAVAPAGSEPKASQEVSEQEITAAGVNKTNRAKEVSEMRARLAAKIESLRAKRKALGSGAEGAPSSRQAILESRRKKDQLRQERKRVEREDAKRTEVLKLSETNPEVVDEVRDVKSDSDPERGEEDEALAKPADGLSFGRIATLDRRESREAKQRDPKTALAHALAKRARISGMPTEQRDKIGESDAWHKALLLAEGDKRGAKSVVRTQRTRRGSSFSKSANEDDVAGLRKAVKRQEAQKKKSEKEWRERLANIAKAKAAKQRNREQNLKDRRDSKGKKGGHKRGPQVGHHNSGKKGGKKRPGFEGRR
ncbi:hypothetical protein PYCC9005_003965 [Savitreella phatthalungensis]